MDAKQKAKDLILKHFNCAKTEFSDKMDKAKQDAIISMEEVISYAQTFGDVTELDIKHFNEVITEIRNFGSSF